MTIESKTMVSLITVSVTCSFVCSFLTVTASYNKSSLLAGAIFKMQLFDVIWCLGQFAELGLTITDQFRPNIVCTISGFLCSVGTLGSLAYTLVISLELKNLISQTNAHNSKCTRYLIYLNQFAFFPAVIFSLSVLIANDFGPSYVCSVINCFIVSGVNFYGTVATLFMPIYMWTIISFNIYKTAQVSYMLYGSKKYLFLRDSLRPHLFYPLIQIYCFIFIDAASLLANAGIETTTFFGDFAMLTLSQFGFLNFICYGRAIFQHQSNKNGTKQSFLQSNGTSWDQSQCEIITAKNFSTMDLETE